MPSHDINLTPQIDVRQAEETPRCHAGLRRVDAFAVLLRGRHVHVVCDTASPSFDWRICQVSFELTTSDLTFRRFLIRKICTNPPAAQPILQICRVELESIAFIMFSHTLPPLDETGWDMAADELQPIHPHFFVPRLSEKPQDPIMDTLKLRAHQRSTDRLSAPPLPLELLALADLMLPPIQDEDTPNLFWNRAFNSHTHAQVRRHRIS